MPIRLLPDELASQIAAGEVVERPASVVKELVENALDAGADEIRIRIEGSGLALIEVVDNGQGIPGDEVSLALARHATSKVHSLEDLSHIASLGFRGEALAAIASVSRLTQNSRTPEAETATEQHADGGTLAAPQASGAPPGTAVSVEDLFYNTPARRKFLKRDVTERRHVSNLVTRYALAYPGVRFSLEIDGRQILRSSGSRDRRELLAALYSPGLARRMIEVDADYGDIKVHGFLGPMDATRANRGQMTFFVNGRWVQDIGLSSALVQGFHGMLMVGRYPIAVLFVELPAGGVDVNVHPTKAEVRFVDRDEVFSSVQRAVRRALLAHAPVPDIQPGITWHPAAAARPEPAWEAQPDLGLQDEPEEEAADEERPAQPPLPRSESALLRLVGQVGSAYLVAEGPDGLYLVDQHAAHERVLYERFSAQKAEMGSQTLLEPQVVELSASQTDLLESQLDLLNSLGFEIEAFGPNTFRMRAMPALLIGSDPEVALRVVVEDFEEDEAPLETEREAKLIARVCKRAAVKAGQLLSIDEQKTLLDDLQACEAPRTCPHGRPTMIHLSIDLLERQFGRRGAR
jgi:DNA mismatch repair protein MutL